MEAQDPLESRVIKMLEEGKTITEIAHETGCSIRWVADVAGSYDLRQKHKGTVTILTTLVCIVIFLGIVALARWFANW